MYNCFVSIFIYIMKPEVQHLCNHLQDHETQNHKRKERTANWVIYVTILFTFSKTRKFRARSPTHCIINRYQEVCIIVCTLSRILEGTRGKLLTRANIYSTFLRGRGWVTYLKGSYFFQVGGAHILLISCIIGKLNFHVAKNLFEVV